MKVTRARVVPVLLLALAGVGVIAVQSPANAAVTSTSIATPLDGTHYTVTSLPGANVTVAGTSNGSPGDLLEIRCYSVGSSDWQPGPTNVAVGADGSFSVQMAISAPYQTCRLKAVPQGYPEGSSLTNFTGPRVTSEYLREFKVQSGPNAGKLYDYALSYQGAEAAFDTTSATSGGYWESRLSFPDGSSSNYFWDGTNASLQPVGGATRSPVRIDGRNAYGPGSAFSAFGFGAPVPGLPSLSWSHSRDGVTGLTRITEKNPLVACPKGTPYPANSGNCATLSSLGVRLERSYVIADKGRQVHITDVWRSTDHNSHMISAYYRSAVHGIDYRGNPDTATDVAFKMPWVGGFQTFTGEATYPAPTKLANSILVRDSNTAVDGDTLLPRGAVTFDFPAKVHRTAYNSVTFEASTFTVPAGGKRTIRQSYVIGTTDAEVLAKAKANETRINPYRADAWIEKLGSGSFRGNNVYNTTGVGQNISWNLHRSQSATFLIAVQNDGTRFEDFRVKGNAAPAGFVFSYLLGRGGATSVTSSVVHGTLTLHSIPPGEAKYVRLVITVKAGTSIGKLASSLITASPTSDSTRKDAVKVTVKVVS